MNLPIILKTPSQVRGIREVNNLNRDLLHILYDKINIGVKTIELNNIVIDFCKKHNVIPAFKGYNNFPFCLCVSINDEVVHGFPSDRFIEDGDVVNINKDETVIFCAHIITSNGAECNVDPCQIEWFFSQDFNNFNAHGYLDDSECTSPFGRCSKIYAKEGQINSRGICGDGGTMRVTYRGLVTYFAIRNCP